MIIAMRLLILALLISITCSACFDGDIQIVLEEVDSHEKGLVDEDRKKTFSIEFNDSKDDQVAQSSTQESSEQQTTESEVVEPQETEVIEAESVAVGQSSEKNYGELLQEKMDLTLQKTAEDFKETNVIEEIERINQKMREHLAQSDDLDDALAKYGVDRKTIELHSNLFANQSNLEPQETSTNKVQDDVVSIPGSTSIKTNSDGYGFTVDLSGDYLFVFDQATVKQEAKATLEIILSLHQQYDGTAIDVSGFTDSLGSNGYNLALSKRRAKAIKKWFESQGVSSSLITATGYGEAEPLATNTLNNKDNPNGRRLNRRVNIAVKTKNKIDLLLKSN